MVVANVLLPESVKFQSTEAISVSKFLNILYMNREDIEDFLEVENAKKNPNTKFYNFDDIINEY